MGACTGTLSLCPFQRPTLSDCDNSNYMTTLRGGAVSILLKRQQSKFFIRIFKCTLTNLMNRTALVAACRHVPRLARWLCARCLIRRTTASLKPPSPGSARAAGQPGRARS